MCERLPVAKLHKVVCERVVCVTKLCATKMCVREKLDVREMCAKDCV